MKRNIADLIRVGILVPALVVTMVGCGTATAKGADAKAEEETVAAEEAKPAEEAAPAAEDKVYENKGFKVTVPGELADKITVETPDDNEDGVIFNVYETASAEASKAKTDQNWGAGWLFTITSRTEEQVKIMLASDYPGEFPIARLEDGSYLVYHHPTDVRYERETPEQMQADQDQWTQVVEWGNTMKDKFLEENAGITKFNWSGTVLEAYLARTAYDKEAVYTLSTLEFAADGVLEPNENVDAEKYFKLMTEDATYEVIDDQDIDGEYVVLNFPEDEVRFDFFYGEDNDRKNLIRQVWGDYEQIYKVTFADETKSANDIMDAWARELAQYR